MKLRYLLVASLVGGLVLFAWGYVVHGTGLFAALTPHSFSDSTAVVETIRTHAPVNGVYLDERGLFATVALERGTLGPRFASMVVPLAMQFLVEVVVALLLAWLLLRLPLWTAVGTGILFASVAVAAGVAMLFPQSIWYGFPLPYQLANLVDIAVGWFLLGIVLASLRRKWMVSVES